MRKIPKEIKELYNGLGKKAEIYAKLRWKLCPFEKIASFLPAQGKILDAGSGYGLLANYLALQSSDRKIIGIDSSSNRLAGAKATIGQRSNIKFVQRNIQDIDISKYQAVVMSDFLHHLRPEVSRDLLVKIFKALDDNGRLVIQEVDRTPYLKYLLTISIDRFLNLGQSLYYQSAAYWQNLLEEIGFQVEVVPAHQGLPLADVIFICQK